MKIKQTAAVILLSIISISVAAAKLPDWKLVIRVKGVVESKLASATAWNVIWQSRKLQDGDMTRTGQDGRAKIRLSDQSIITLGENTEVEMSQFKIEEKSTTTKLKLFYGKVRSKVGRFTGKESSYEVQTPNALLAARGTEFYTAFEEYGEDKEKTTKLIVFESEVDLKTDKMTKTITAGNSAIVGANGIIQVNPPGFSAIAPGAAKAEGDGDLMSEIGDIEGAEYTGQIPPADPSAIVGPSVPGTPQNPGGIVPQPGQTGDIQIIITPHKGTGK